MLDLDGAHAWYPIDDPVHGYDHIVRVYRIAEQLAAAEGADLEIVRAAALLHDAQDAVSPRSPVSEESSPVYIEQGKRRDHQRSSAEFTQQILQAEGWPEKRIAAVLHCIRAHRFRDNSENPTTLEAQVLFDADKLDAIGAIGTARAIAYAVMANQPVYAKPSLLFIQTGKTEPGEAHSAYHEYVYKLSKIRDRMYTASGKKLAQDRDWAMSEFFQRLQREWEAEA
jgi:uncharacterized protein